MPLDQPALGLQADGGKVIVSASWNGSTEVARWRVLAGAGPDTLRRVAEAAKDGFETAIPAASDARYFAVQALDANGQVLRTSKAVRRPR